MKTNETLWKEVQEAIKWEPLLNAAEIGVTAKDGVVTLTGMVDGYAKKSKPTVQTKIWPGSKPWPGESQLRSMGWPKHSNGEVATANAFN